MLLEHRIWCVTFVFRVCRSWRSSLKLKHSCRQKDPVSSEVTPRPSACTLSAFCGGTIAACYVSVSSIELAAQCCVCQEVLASYNWEMFNPLPSLMLQRACDLTLCRRTTYIYTAPLSSRRRIFYIYSTNIHTEYFKHAAHSPFFFSLFKMPFLYNGYWVFPGGKAAGAWCWPPTPS
jgi:hypothetical protein